MATNARNWAYFVGLDILGQRLAECLEVVSYLVQYMLFFFLFFLLVFFMFVDHFKLYAISVD